MYRAYLTRYLPGAYDPAECPSNIVRKKDDEDGYLYGSQIEWVISLCKKSPEDLFRTAKKYADSGNPYERETADNIRPYILWDKHPKPILRTLEGKFSTP